MNNCTCGRYVRRAATGDTCGPVCVRTGSRAGAELVTISRSATDEAGRTVARPPESGYPTTVTKCIAYPLYDRGGDQDAGGAGAVAVAARWRARACGRCRVPFARNGVGGGPPGGRRGSPPAWSGVPRASRNGGSEGSVAPSDPYRVCFGRAVHAVRRPTPPAGARRQRALLDHAVDAARRPAVPCRWWSATCSGWLTRASRRGVRARVHRPL